MALCWRACTVRSGDLRGVCSTHEDSSQLPESPAPGGPAASGFRRHLATLAQPHIDTHIRIIKNNTIKSFKKWKWVVSNRTIKTGRTTPGAGEIPERYLPCSSFRLAAREGRTASYSFPFLWGGWARMSTLLSIEKKPLKNCGFSFY